MIQFFTNFSNMLPSNRLQFLQNCSSVGSFRADAVLQQQATPAWVSHRPHLVPRACSGVGFPQAAASFKTHSPGPVWGPPCAAEGQLALPWSLLWTSREPLFQHLAHLLPLLLQWPWCLHSCFSHIVSLLSQLLMLSVIYPFLNMLSQRHYYIGCFHY